MKRHFFKTIVAFMVVMASLAPAVVVFSADDAAKRPPSEIETACQDAVPDKMYEEVWEKIESKDLNPDYNGVMEAIEDSRVAYHNYNVCLFTEAQGVVLGGAWFQGPRTTGGTVTVNTPNIPDVPDWMKPDLACRDEKELGTIIRRSSADAILPALILGHQKYKEQLDALKNWYDKNYKPVADAASTTDPLTKASQEILGMGELINTELEDAWQAVNISLLSLKELRMAFVMHVHFQCMLNNLERYRRVLEDIRGMAESLPNLLHDASMHKGG